MKRKTAALALMLGIIGTVVMTGCGAGTNVNVDASKNEDLSAKVTDTNKVEDSKEAYQKFLDAQQAMEDTESLTINTELLVKIDDKEASETNSQRFDIKRMKDGDKQVVDFNMKTEANAVKEDGTVDEENSNSRELPGYFYDGMLYYTQTLSEDGSDSVKLKEEITYEDLMSVIGSTYILNDVTADQIETTAVEEKGGTTQYIYILGKDAMSDYMHENLSASGVPFDEDGGVDINHANISAEINKDGILTSYTFSVDAIIRDETGEVPFSYNIASAFTGVNSTKVNVRSEDELSEYITTDEYAEQLQKEQQELADMPVEENTQGDEGMVITPEEVEDIDLELSEGQTASVKIGE